MGIFDAYYKVVDTVGFEPMNAGTKKDGQAIYDYNLVPSRGIEPPTY